MDGNDIRSDRRRRRGLRLPLHRRSDPVLTPDEIDWLAEIVRGELAQLSEVCDGWRSDMQKSKPSEADIRSRMTSRDVLGKLYEAGAWWPSGEAPIDV